MHKHFAHQAHAGKTVASTRSSSAASLFGIVINSYCGRPRSAAAAAASIYRQAQYLPARLRVTSIFFGRFK